MYILYLHVHVYSCVYMYVYLVLPMYLLLCLLCLYVHGGHLYFTLIYVYNENLNESTLSFWRGMKIYILFAIRYQYILALRVQTKGFSFVRHIPSPIYFLLHAYPTRYTYLSLEFLNLEFPEKIIFNMWTLMV